MSMQKMLCKYNAILWIGFFPKAYKAFAQWVERRLALNKLKYAIQAAL